MQNLSQRDMERFIALQAQDAKQQAAWRAVRDYRAYYAGDHPVFLSDRQREYLGDLLTEAEHTVAFNVCLLVVDTLRERLHVDGFKGTDGAGQTLAKKVSEWWRKAQMDTHAITVHRRALRDGAGYLIVGWDKDRGAPVWVPNRRYDGAEGVTYYKDPDTGKPAMALKYWTVTDPLSERHGKRRRTVYLPDRILRYKEDARGEFGWTLVTDEQADGPAVQWWTDTMKPDGAPLGVACIEFQNPGGVSEIENVIGLQNGVNKTLLDIQAAADATGFQIVTISYTGPQTSAPVDDEDSTSDDLQIAPGRALELFDGSTAGTLPPGDLSQLIATLRTLVSAVSATSRTPQYYLWPAGGNEVPSGEALKQLESGLVSRATERQTLFGPAWETAMQMGARLYAAMGSADVDAEAELSVVWGSAEMRNEFVDGQVAEMHQRLGVPSEELWVSKLGYTQEDAQRFKRLALARKREEVATTVQAMREGNETESGDMAQVVAQYQQAAGALGRLGSNGNGGR